MLRQRGTPCVLGLRDVMDEPGLLAPEWERKQVVPALQRYFDDIWVYGLPQICDPLAGIELPDSVRKRMTYTGYLKRSLPKARPHIALEKIGRASCRERVCQYVSIQGVTVYLKKKKKRQL